MSELNIFLIFFLLGMTAAGIFFAGAYFTGKIKKIKFQIPLECILFVLYLCVLFAASFYLILKINMGIIRFYMPAAMIFGFILCQKTICKTFALILNKVYNNSNGRKRKKSSDS